MYIKHVILTPRRSANGEDVDPGGAGRDASPRAFHPHHFPVSFFVLVALCWHKNIYIYVYIFISMYMYTYTYRHIKHL